ncbi:hypothetical protein X566_20045 [Afipia sp. P52-10]|uniref:hypothetical protein n=1 Tax=Afipia sp. P52-10 TaxID=1429916 RepID=UPI0003DF1F76|nr:hypothetical protein [Afipia sp. P52-10]ETR75056.1 hypothetical protein X566_20045 [Afipia sp. P52-10]
MKGFAIRQPWAWAIFSPPEGLRKDIENREWQPTNPGLRFRGRCVILATAHPGDSKWFDRWSEFCETVLAMPGDTDDACNRIPDSTSLVFGALIGTVEIVDVVTAHSSPWFFGPYGLVLREPRPFKNPIPYKGALGFFDVPDRILPHA